MALDIAAKCLDCLQHLVGRFIGGRFESQPINDVADSPQLFIFISGSGIDVDAHSGEGTGKRLGGYPEAIREFCDGVELGRVLGVSD